MARVAALRAGPAPVALVAALAAGHAPVVAQAAPDDPPFRIETLAPGVYAGVANRNPPMYVFANALIVIGDDGALVVDTHASPSAARAMIAHIHELTGVPVRWVVNTHEHPDHIYGNAEYRRAFPDVRFVMHATAAEEVAGHAQEWIQREREDLAASLEERDRWLAEGVGPDGSPLTPAQHAQVQRSRRLRAGQLEELPGLEIPAADVTVTDSLVIDVGGRTVHVLAVQPAHTRGDVVVWLPDERILAAGDLIEEGVPYAGEGFPAGWSRVLERLAALDPAITLPSHGGVQRDGALLQAQLALFHAIVTAARTGYCEGRSPEETASRAAAELERGGPPPGVGAEAFAAFVEAAASRAFFEADAEGRDSACRLPLSPRSSD